LPFADASFDVVWTQHVAMNVEDKAALYRELRRVVRPGGRLALFDAVAGQVGPIRLPVPWADRPSRSFLERPERIREHIESAGFAVATWDDETRAALDAFGAPPSGPASSLGLALVVPNLREKVANYMRNLIEDRVRLLRCVATAV
jgi:SAM-dependent methyltransferase